MKRFIVALLVVVVSLGATLVSAAGTASAAPCDSYAGCSPTTTRLAPVKVDGRKASLTARVITKGSKAVPKGQVTIRVFKEGLTRSVTVNLNGRGVARATMTKLPKGSYKTKVIYSAKAGTPYRNSTGGNRFFKIR